ncbi:hypothetical protein BO71DRAFT_396821 [Aspergillus ellipticus CBS 707.79]|uniref:Uncharacterized protein n=1 Tax=Aspergillus ellipticus CBS 707.79 TaxID=1448320 RepID=A0A319DGX0_9EURO|nr:hypothetical protein BO71DRAFT_396821 [Aspergillus ellipticus CBS 707.79]
MTKKRGKPECVREFESEREKAPNRRYMKETDKMIKWRSEFRAEETLGIAILQRQHRLQLEQMQQGEKQEQSTKAEKERDINILPAYSLPVRPFEAEIKEMRIEYWKHHSRMWRLLRDLPSSGTVDYMLVHRRHQDESNSSFIWIKDQRICAETGGCCGRDCGCCEKALHKYYQPDPSYEAPKPKKPFYVHGHCTVECACCIKFRQCYMPHPKLPVSKTSLC